MIDATEEKFSLVIGGPFYRLQQRLGLLGADNLPPWRTALLFSLVAWLPPAIFSVMQGFAWGGVLGERAFFLDFSVHARFFVAVLMFTVMESIAERRIAAIIPQFNKAGLVPPDEQQRFSAALARADRRSSSSLAELVVLVVAYAATLLGVANHLSVLQTSWLGSLVDGNTQLTLAGWWALLVSFPLFWFLLLRWLWRFAVWSILLRDLAGLKLRLVATHPDKSGGIGFLGLFPPTFAALVFALSGVTASVILQKIVFAGMSLQSVGHIFAVWLLLVVVIFVGPLAIFMTPLKLLKKRALLEYGELASVHNRAFEARWVRGKPVTDDVLGTPDISSLADLAAGFDAVRSMRLIPAGQEAFVPLVVAASVPWLAVAATQVPLVEILKTVAKALL